MSNVEFSGYKQFAAYLAKHGWLAPGADSSVEAACAAFQSFQRLAGIEAAKAAMNKACEKAR